MRRTVRRTTWGLLVAAAIILAGCGNSAESATPAAVESGTPAASEAVPPGIVESPANAEARQELQSTVADLNDFFSDPTVERYLELYPGCSAEEAQDEIDFTLRLTAETLSERELQVEFLTDTEALMSDVATGELVSILEYFQGTGWVNGDGFHLNSSRCSPIEVQRISTSAAWDLSQTELVVRTAQQSFDAVPSGERQRLASDLGVQIPTVTITPAVCGDRPSDDPAKLMAGAYVENTTDRWQRVAVGVRWFSDTGETFNQHGGDVPAVAEIWVPPTATSFAALTANAVRDPGDPTFIDCEFSGGATGHSLPANAMNETPALCLKPEPQARGANGVHIEFDSLEIDFSDIQLESRIGIVDASFIQTDFVLFDSEGLPLARVDHRDRQSLSEAVDWSSCLAVATRIRISASGVDQGVPSAPDGVGWDGDLSTLSDLLFQ